ncbi:hypothetical protein [Haloarchaeobius baliensis]|uniref:hypothetical protein n=1 Tax=Haloarchaeobius baliensis TaxID=1670458 RepID=UPI003F883E8D
MNDPDGTPAAGTLGASPGFELALLAIVALPFAIVLSDGGSVAVGPLGVAAAAAVGWDLLFGSRGELGFAGLDWWVRTVLLVVGFSAVAGTLVLVRPPLPVYASASLGLVGGLAVVRFGRLVAG